MVRGGRRIFSEHRSEGLLPFPSIIDSAFILVCLAPPSTVVDARLYSSGGYRGVKDVFCLDSRDAAKKQGLSRSIAVALEGLQFSVMIMHALLPGFEPYVLDHTSETNAAAPLPTQE